MILPTRRARRLNDPRPHHDGDGPLRDFISIFRMGRCDLHDVARAPNRARCNALRSFGEARVTIAQALFIASPYLFALVLVSGTVVIIVTGGGRDAR